MRIILVSFLGGAVPFSGAAARLTKGVDLRTRGTGTVSGTGLYEVAGFGPLALAGSLDVAKGALGPLLAGSERPRLQAIAGAAAIAGHNWSPFLGGAGGRGISPALGVSLVAAPEAAAVLLAGLAGGRLVKQTAAGCLIAMVLLVPLLVRRRGRTGAVDAGCVIAPMIIKRLVGNRLPARGDIPRALVTRLVFDRDPLT